MVGGQTADAALAVFAAAGGWDYHFDGLDL